MTSAWAADREFFYIYLSLWLPLASFGCLWNAFGAPWADFRLHFNSFGGSRAPSGRPLGAFGSLWNALGLPLAALWAPFGHPGTYGACLKFIKITYDYRRERLQFKVKTYDSRREG